jgi:hypothetical protein
MHMQEREMRSWVTEINNKRGYPELIETDLKSAAGSQKSSADNAAPERCPSRLVEEELARARQRFETDLREDAVFKCAHGDHKWLNDERYRNIGFSVEDMCGNIDIFTIKVKKVSCKFCGFFEKRNPG